MFANISGSQFLNFARSKTGSSHKNCTPRNLVILSQNCKIKEVKAVQLQNQIFSCHLIKPFRIIIDFVFCLLPAFCVALLSSVGFGYLKKSNPARGSRERREASNFQLSTCQHLSTVNCHSRSALIRNCSHFIRHWLIAIRRDFSFVNS